jgi:nucleotide-binding universal stress UspA family protein
MAKTDRVVVPVDFSPLSKHALRAALAMARRTPLEVHLLHVIPEYEVHSAFHIALPAREEVEVKAQQWATKAFDTYLRGEDLSGSTLVRAVRYGNPARLICEYTEEVGAAAIVIASHGRSGFERAVFGSVAEKVLRTCRQPVMVVKGEP